MFIGRKKELNFLEELYQKPGGQLVILYGRRRIGKTETLKKFCENKEHVFYTCTEISNTQQLQLFSERMLQKNIPASKYLTVFTNWEQAFANITDLPGNGKKLLVIDEFPYMVKSDTSIPSILQKLWDESLKSQNIMLVLCGSAMSFIEKEILAEKNPLYGRSTGILKMLEMDFFSAGEFFKGYSTADKIAAYSVLGGVPHYLRQFDGQLSLKENIIKTILTPGGILYSEVEFIMRQELRETAIYNSIITAIALGNTKLNDIHQKTQIEKTKLSSYLKNLLELGIITREFPVTGSVKETANIQRGLYQVTSNFFRFWYAFVFPNISSLESGDAEGIWNYSIAPQLDFYCSHIFENICIQYLRKKNIADELPFHFIKIGRWWDKDRELDIMAVDQNAQNYLLGECKYKNTPFSIDDFKNMQGKFNCSNANLFYYLFSKSGFTQQIPLLTQNSNIFAITADDILK